MQDQRRSGERHSANRLPLPYDLPTKHYRWREKRNADCRGCRFGYLASVSTHFAEKVSCQSCSCHCGILARFSSHSETRLPLGLCRRAELKTHGSAEQRNRSSKSTARVPSGKNRDRLTEKSKLGRTAYGNWNHWSRRFSTSIRKTGIEGRTQGEA